MLFVLLVVTFAIVAGQYRRADGYVYLRNSNTQGPADIKFYFGNPGDFPLSGDFNGDGCDTVSLYRQSEGRVYIINRLGDNDGGLGAADYDYYFGNPGDKPFVGDFDGDGFEVGSLSVALEPGRMHQENEPYRRVAGRNDIDGGYATVTVTAGSGIVAYGSVIDNGTGITAENQQRIFEAGYTTKNRGLGSGLGGGIDTEDLGDLIVSRRNGQPVYLREVAEITTELSKLQAGAPPAPTDDVKQLLEDIQPDDLGPYATAQIHALRAEAQLVLARVNDADLELAAADRAASQACSSPFS